MKELNTPGTLCANNILVVQKHLWHNFESLQLYHKSFGDWPYTEPTPFELGKNLWLSTKHILQNPSQLEDVWEKNQNIHKCFYSLAKFISKSPSPLVEMCPLSISCIPPDSLSHFFNSRPTQPPPLPQELSRFM